MVFPGWHCHSSFLAHKHAQHEGARGALPERKRLAIPMFLGNLE
jgi:hypothetical protein